MDRTERQTRDELINAMLESAGWKRDDRTSLQCEVPIEKIAERGVPNGSQGLIARDRGALHWQADPSGICDYCLYDDAGNILAVIEAKKFSRNAREGEEQLRQYLEAIARVQSFMPFGFLTNGRHVFFWDYGYANPRMVAGFFRREDLMRLLRIRKEGLSLDSIAINTDIVNRPYQHEAVRRVAERFTEGHRRALLVMATGTGKTRTTMALIDLFLRSNQGRHVLFLADRDTLVEQALTDGFKAFLPDEPRDRIHTWRIDTTKRLFVATEQTLLLCYKKFSPGFFDLIIYDEAHRSIFNRQSEVVDYFDARMIGLTATPDDFIDRDTFRVFGCQNSTPTFLYDYPQAVTEKYLADFSVYRAQTGFQRNGIRGASLTEEDRNALVARGIDPDSINYDGTELEDTVSNRDTLRKQWEEIMEACLKDQSGQLPGKTIIFAMTQKHANRLRDVFEEMYPMHQRVVQVITSSTERVHDGTYGDGLISQFKKNEKPRIAISVDMLDTGVDVPEVVNLVFMKPVQSHIKLWQMIGRGTRSNETCKYHHRLPDGRKTEFRILDFWQNDFNREPVSRSPQNLPILVALFNTRLQLAEATMADASGETHRQAVTDLRALVNRIPTETYSIRKVLDDVEEAWRDDFWIFLNTSKFEFLRNRVGPLLRFVADVDVAAETFTHKIERLRLQLLRGTPSPDTIESIADDVSRLPPFVLEVASLKPSVHLCLSRSYTTSHLPALRQAVTDLAKHMKDRRARPSAFLDLDLPDYIATRGLLSIGDGGEQIYVEEYRQRIENRILALVENNAALDAIRNGQPVEPEQLVELERLLRHKLGDGELHVNPENIRKAYGIRVDNFLAFLGHVLDLESMPDYRSAIGTSFEKFIAAHNFNADQIRFLRAVQEVFMQKHSFAAADLYEPPLDVFGRNAPDRYFTESEVGELLKLTESLAA